MLFQDKYKDHRHDDFLLLLSFTLFGICYKQNISINRNDDVLQQQYQRSEMISCTKEHILREIDKDFYFVKRGILSGALSQNYYYSSYRDLSVHTETDIRSLSYTVSFTICFYLALEVLFFYLPGSRDRILQHNSPLRADKIPRPELPKYQCSIL